MQAFIDALPPVETPTPMLIFVTQANWSGNGAYFLRHEIETKGYAIRWAVHINMPSNIWVDLGGLMNWVIQFFGVPIHRSIKTIKRLADRIAAKRPWIHGKYPAISFGWLQRLLWRKGIQQVQGRIWSVDAEKCSRCGSCARICPVENISLVDGLPQFTDHCNVC